ncbi:hypothetical protein K501DRAFT_266968 [Backusella circina FSU 941]|nr:hypothetical protein K501DRAFT_266968 [Backusella circina FSU 941]
MARSYCFMVTRATSSTQEHNVNNICNIFEDRPLRLKWHHAHFGFSHAKFFSSTEGIKDVGNIWKELPQYNATNTIAIDDTLERTIPSCSCSDGGRAFKQS